jgi:hypothetical protein
MWTTLDSMTHTDTAALTAADWSAIYAQYNADTLRHAQEWDAKAAAGELGHVAGLTLGYVAIDNP